MFPLPIRCFPKLLENYANGIHITVLFVEYALLEEQRTIIKSIKSDTYEYGPTGVHKVCLSPSDPSMQY